MNCEYIKITSKEGIVTLEDLENGLTLNIQPGDKIFIGEYTQELKFEIIGDSNLRIIFPDGTMVVLNNIIDLLDNNTNISDLNDTNAIEAFLTKLDFLDSSTNEIELNSQPEEKLTLLSVDTYEKLIELMQETAAGTNFEESVEFVPEEESSENTNQRTQQDETEFTNLRSEFLETITEEDAPVEDINDPLILTVTPIAVLTENSATTTTVISTSTATDIDGGGITFTLATNPSGFYVIDESTGTVTLSEAGVAHVNAGNDLPSYSVTAQSTTGNTSSETVIIDVVATTNVDDETVLTLNATSATEDVTQAGATVATFSVSDEDETASVDFTAGTNDDGYYAIEGNNVVLTEAGEAFLDAGNTLPEISLTTSGTSTDKTETATPETIATDDETVLTLNATSATEDVTQAGATVATFSVSDEDETASVDFTAGTNDDGYYAIEGNNVVLTEAGEAFLDAGNTLPEISLTTSGTSTDKTETATPETIATDDETVLTLNATSATEDVTQAGATVATFSVSDEDETASVDFTAGTNDDGYYAIEGNNVVLTEAGEAFLDAGNTLPEISLTTSGTSTDKTETATPETIATDDETVLTLNATSATEDVTQAGATVATFSVSDEDETASVDFTAGTNDDGYYAIEGNNVVLTEAGEAFLDAGNTLPEISLTTSGTSTDKTETATPETIATDDETVLTLNATSATEDVTQAGATVATFSVSDEDETASVDFTAGTNDDGYYAIEGNNVVLTEAGEAFLDAGNTLPEISLTTSGTSTDKTETATPETIATDDETVLTLNATSATEDVTQAGATVATFSVSDEDETASVDFTAGTNDDGYYAIEGNNVVLTEAGEAFLDAGNTLPEISLTTSGTSTDKTETATPETIATDDETVLTLNATSATEDVTQAGATVATFSVSDEDETASVDFTAGTNDDGYYAIEGNNVVLTEAGEAFLDAGNTLPEISLTTSGTSTDKTETATPETIATDDETVLTLNATSATEDVTQAGATVATFSVSDEDETASVDFTAGTNDDGYYAIEGNNVVLTEAGEAFLDAGNTLPEISLTTSGTSTDKTETATPETIATDDETVLTLNATSATEDVTQAGATVATFSVSDEDETASVDFTAGTNDDGYYAIEGNNVVLTEAGEAFLDAGNTLPEISLTTSGTSTDKTETATPETIATDDETVLTLNATSATEDVTQAGATVATFSVSDEDETASVDFTAGTNDDGYYAIEGNNVVLTEAGEAFLDAGNTLPEISLTTSGTSTDKTETATPETIATDDETVLTLNATSATEDVTQAGATVATFSVSDEDETASVDFTAGTNDDGYYAIEGNNVVLTEAGEAFLDAGNTLPEISLTTSGTSTDKTETATPETIATDDETVLTLNATSATEDVTQAGATVATFSVSDEDETASVDFTAGTNDDGYYAIEGNNVVLTEAGEAFLDAGNTLPEISLTTSGTSTDKTETATPETIATDDETVLTLNATSATEDVTQAGATVATFSVSDEDETASVDFTAGTNDDGYYAIEGNNVVLTEAGEAFLDAGNTLPEISLTTSGTSTDKTETATPETIATDDETVLTLNATSATEDVTQAGATVATFSVSDEDETASVDFTAGTNDDGYYAIEGNNVVLTEAGEAFLDAGNTLPEISLTTSGTSTDKTETATPETIATDDETVLTLNATSATEDVTQAGATVATFSVSDEDETASVDFTAGTNDDGYYAIEGNNVVLTEAGEAFLDAGNTLPEISLTTSGTSTDKTETATPETIATDDETVLTLNATSATEDVTQAGATVATFSVSDEDETASVDFTAGTNDDGYYAIEGNNVVLTEAGEAFLDAGNTLPEISLTTSGTSTDKTETATPETIATDDETVLTLNATSATEDVTQAGATVATFSVSDEDETASVDFTAGTNDDGYYAIEGNNVVLTEAGEAFLDAGNTLPEISLTTSGTSTDKTETATPETIATDDETVLTLNATSATEDVTQAGATVATFSVSDEDETASVDFTAGTNDDGYYAIEGNNVVLTEAGEAFLDAGNTLPEISLTTSGTSTDKTETATPETIATDDETVLTLNATSATEDVTQAGATVATFSVSDEDETASVDFTAGTNDDGYYAIEGNNVVLTEAGEAFLDAGNTLPEISLTTSGTSTDKTETATPETIATDDETVLTLNATSATEDVTQAGATVATFSVSDEDETASVDFTAGTNDDGYYAIEGNNVVLTEAGEAFLDAGNTLPEISLTTSGTSTDKTETATPETIATDDETVLTLNATSATEDVTQAGATVATFSVSDEDETASVDFTAGTNDDGYYAIEGNNVVLTEAGEAFLDAGNTLPEISLTTSGTSTDKTETATPETIATDDETVLTLNATSATEDVTQAGATVATFSVSDEDETASVDFTAGTNDDGYYAIEGNNVVLTEAGEAFLDAGNTLPEISLTTSGTSTDKTETATPETIATDDETVLTLNATSATEDVTQAGATVATFSVSDEDETASVDFTAGTNDDGYYAIEGNNVVLTEAGEAFLDAGNTLPEISLTTSGTSTDKTETATPETIATDDETVLTLNATSATEDVTQAGATVATFSVSDEDETASVDFTAGTNDDGYYAIEGNNVVLTEAGEAFLDAGNTLPEISLTTSGTSTDKTETATPETIATDDETVLTLNATSATEDVTQAGATVATFSVSDEDETASVDFTAGTNDDGYYAIEGNNVVLTEAGEAFLDAGNTLPEISLTTSGTSTDKTETATPETIATDDETVLTLNATSATEDVTQAGATVATFSVSDEDETASVDFTAGTNDDGYYAIEGNNVVLTEAGEAFLDAGNTLPEISLTTSGTSTDKTETATPETIATDDETVLTLNATSATEDVTQAGATVATFSVSDEDETASVDFTAGTNDDGYYAIEGNNVVLTEAGEAFLDAGNTLPEISLTTSGTSTDKTETATPETIATDDETVLTLNATSATEDVTQAGATVATFSVSDEDETASVDFTAGTNDDGYYAIEGNNVVLTEAGEAFLDAGNTLPEISLTTSGTSTDKTETATPETITVNDPLILEVSTVDSIVEDSVSEGFTIATSSATDEDGGDITYSLQGNPVFYDIDENTGEVTLTEEGAAHVNAGNNLPSFHVNAESTTGNTSSDRVKVTPVDTTDVNDNPDAIDDSTVTESVFLGTKEEDGTLSEWGSQNNDGSMTFTTDSGNEISISATRNGEPTSIGFMDSDLNNQQGVGIGAVGGNDAQIEENETVTIDFGGTVSANTEIGLAGLGGHFVDTHSADAKATWTAFDSDGNIVASGEIQQDDDGTPMTNSFTVGVEFASIEFGLDANINSNFTIQYVDTEYIATELTTEEDTSLTINAESLLANDTDEDGDTLTITDVTATDDTHGTVSIDLNGNIVFTPEANYEGEATFTYTVSDGNGGTDTATVTVNVTPDGYTLAPTSDLDPLSDTGSSNTDNITSDNTPTINGTTEPGATVVITTSAGVVIGTATANENGEYSITTSELPDGEQTLTITATDTAGNSSSTTETLTIDTVATAENDTASVGEDSSVIINVLANDETGSIITSVQTPVNSEGEPLGTVEIVNVDGVQKIQFTPADNYDELNSGESENVTFIYQTQDVNGNTGEATVNVTVEGVNNDLTYVSESAGYKNVVGYYELDENGNPTGEIKVVIDDQNGMQGGTHLDDMNPNTEYGFFIIANGASSIEPDSTLTFEMVDGVPVLEVDGNTISQPVYHDNPSFNGDGKDHFKFESDGDGGTNIRIEDLPNLGDQDFNDVVMNTNFEINVNDALELTVTPVDTITEDAVDSGFTVATSSATDEDGGDIEFSITDDTNGFYSIDIDSGEVTLTQAGADHVNAGNDLPNFTVSASSTTGNTSSDTASVNPTNTTDVNDALELIVTPVDTITEDAVDAGFTVATSSATDEDGGDIEFSLASNPNGFYAIDENTGTVTLTQAGADHVNAGNDLPNYSISAFSTTGSASHAMVDGNPVNTTEVNDNPDAVDDTSTSIEVTTTTTVFSSSFEEHLDTNSTVFDTNVDGWINNNNGESIEVRDESAYGGDAVDGQKYVELNTDATDTHSDASSISRTVDTVEGATYELEFNFSARPGYNEDVNQFEILVNGEVVGTYSADGTGTGSVSWNNDSVSFTGTGEPMTIEFKESGTSNPDHGRGMFLDDISLTQTVTTTQEQALSTDEDTSITVDVLSNDTDEENETLSISEIQGQDVSAGQTVDITQDGEVVGTARVVDGKIEFTPGEYNSLDDGQNEDVTFEYTVSDGDGGTDSANVTINVSGITDNIDPEATDDVGTEFTPANATLAGEMTFDTGSGTTGPSGSTDGQVGEAGQFNSNKTTMENLDLDSSAGAKTTITMWFKHQSQGDYDWEMLAGSDNFDLTFYGDNLGFNTWSNDVYGFDASEFNDGEWHQITAVITNGNVTQNSIYIDGQEQELSQVRGTPNNSRAYITNDDNDITIGGEEGGYSRYNFNGTLDEVKVFNGELSAEEIATLYDIESEGKHYTEASYSVSEDASITLDVLENDTDSDGGTLSISQIQGQDVSAGQTVDVRVDGEVIGTARVVNGQIEFTANGEAFDDLDAGQNQEINFEYTVSDGQGGSDTATVTLTVNGVTDVTNDASAPTLDISIGTPTVSTETTSDTTTSWDGLDSSIANNPTQSYNGNVNGNIHGGSGDDTVYVGGSTHGEVKLGDGDNNIYIGDDANKKVQTGDGDDNIKIVSDAHHEVKTGDGDDSVDIGNDSNKKIETGDGDDKVRIGDDSNKEVKLGDGDDYLYVNDDTNKKVEAGAGNDYVEVGDRLYDKVDMGTGNDILVVGGRFWNKVDGGEGNDAIELKEYSLADYNNNKDGIQNNIKNFEAIKFNDGNVIGDESYFDNSVSTNSYEYPVDLTATLTDSSETLSSVTISNLPVGVSVKDASNVTDNGDGTYSVTVTSATAASISLISSYNLSNEQLNDIQASVSSTDGDDTATTTANDDLTETAGFDIDISDESSYNIDGNDFDVEGGEGDDSFSLDSDDFTFETADGGSGSSRSGSGSEGSVRTETDNLDGEIDGGDGYDTLIFEDDIDLNFEQMAEDVKNMEAINLKNEQANDLGDISAADVLKMTDDDNVLKILGEDGDQIGLKEDAGWSKGDRVTDEEGESFDVWTNDDATLFVDTDIQVDV